MPEEIQQAPVAQDPIPQDLSPIQDIDRELDTALSESFKNFKPIVDDPKPEPKKVEEKPVAKVEKKNESRQEKKAPEKTDAKPIENDNSPLPDPESFKDNNPKEQQGWNALKNNYKKSHKIIQEREQEIEKLKQTLAEKSSLTQKEIDALKAEKEDLSKYRAVIDIQADPEFIKNYDQPIEKARDSIRDILTSCGVSKEVIQNIDFSNTKLMDEIVGHVAEHKDKFVSRKLQRKIEELVDVSDKREEALRDQKNNFKEIMESKKKEAFSKSAEEEGRMLKHVEALVSGKDKDGNPVLPFLNHITPKEGSPQPDIDRANAHNKMVDMLKGKIDQVLKMNKPEDKAEAAIAAAMAHYFAAELKATRNALKVSQEELAKISTITNETEKSKAAPRRNGNGNNPIDLDSALSTHFANR